MACCSCEYALLASIAGCSTLAHSHVQSTSRTPCLCTGFLTTHLYREGYITWRANIPHYSSLASFPRNSMTPITMPLSHSIILQSRTKPSLQDQMISRNNNERLKKDMVSNWSTYVQRPS